MTTSPTTQTPEEFIAHLAQDILQESDIVEEADLDAEAGDDIEE